MLFNAEQRRPDQYGRAGVLGTTYTYFFLIATITSLTVCQKILNHLKLDSEQVSASSPRDPPYLFESLRICHNFDENQEYNW